MPVYWEQNAGGVQAKNSNMEEDDEDCETQKSHMQNVEDEELIQDLVVNIMLILNM
jgi:hypothetical protein